MEAVLLLCVSLVQGAASTLKMIRARFHRDWHTTDASKDLPQATSSKQLETDLSTVILGPVPRIPVVAGAGSPEFLRGSNRGSRDKPENDSNEGHC